MSGRLILAALLFAPALSYAQGTIVQPPCVAGSPCNGVVHESSAARVTLDNGVLRYEISEVLRNNGTRNAEVDYMFPLPKMAAFQDLAMSIDGEMMAGEILPADRASAIYESIVRRNRDPALVEWMGHGLLRTRIFPIAPGETKHVTVRFQSVAQREGDAIRVDYFVGTRRAQGAAPVPVSLTVQWPDSTRYGSAYSPTHVADSSASTPGRRSISFSGTRSEITVLLPVRSAREPSISVLNHAVPSEEDGFALITLTPPAMPPRVTPRDVVLVLDVSGSMSGPKMTQARAAGRQLLQSLNPRDRFRIINFSTDVGFFEPDFVDASPENVRNAGEYLDALDAAGSTNISNALQEAMRGLGTVDRSRLPLVLFVTDGAPTVGETNVDRITDIVAQSRGRARVFTFGVGADVKPELMEQLALQGQGTAQFVSPGESVEHAMSVVVSRLTAPLVTDLRVSARGVRLERMHPSNVPDLFAGQDLIVLARYSGSGDATLTFEGNSADGPVRWTSNVTFPEREIRNAFVSRIWATQRIGFLSAERRRNGGNPELDAEIRELGERYSIPTMFTSYLVVEPGLVINGVVGGVGPARPGDARAAQGQQGQVGRGGRGGGGGGGGGGRGGLASGVQASPPAIDLTASTTIMGKVPGTVLDAAARDANLRATRSEEGLDAATNGAVRRVGERTFTFNGDAWTDSRVKTADNTTKVKPYSPLYFDLIKALPDLAPVFALGDKVIVAGKSVVISLDESGAERLNQQELAALTKKW